MFCSPGAGRTRQRTTASDSSMHGATPERYGRGYEAKCPGSGSRNARAGASLPGDYPSHVKFRTDKRRRGLFTQ